jgi:hypothetical protein
MEPRLRAFLRSVAVRVGTAPNTLSTDLAEAR